MDELIQKITIYALPIIFAITLHEAAHGYVARYFGDNTAYAQGRVSLNPLRHIDPFGTLVLPLLALLLSKGLLGSGIIFGYAKPVPVNFGNLRDPKRDMLWVALAGPAINFVMALIWAALLKAQLVLGLNQEFFIDMAVAGISINIFIMLINLLPIPPLDGGRVVFSLLPNRLAWRYAKIEPYGMYVVFGLIIISQYVPILSAVLIPFYRATVSLINFIFGFNAS